jgi:glycosyltransferase involved in cell wall biosynthesis/ubiquinone/menaquinone biosynthesis C-methylase UbiE
MKICILVKNYKQPWDEGAKNNIKQIAGRLSKNHRIFFIGISDENAKIDLPEGASYLFKSPYYSTKYRYLFYPLGFLSLLIGSSRVIADRRPDILISSFGTSAFLISLIRLLSGVDFKIVQFIYNDWYSFQRAPLKVWLLEHLYQLLFNNKFLSKVSLSFVDGVIATSQYLQSQLISIGYKNVKFIPTGVDINEYVPERESRKRFKEGKVVAYIGHLVHSKGVSLLLGALLPLLEKENIRLIIASSHSGSDEKIIKRLSHPKVSLFGTVKARDIYNSCDLLVYPRRFSFQTVIYPNIILEAMSCSTPVLTSRLPAIDEIIKDGENGFLIRPNDVIALRNKLLELVRNKNDLERIGYQARETIESKFNWDHIVPEIEKELTLLACSSRPKTSVYESEQSVSNYEKRRFGSYGGRLVNQKELRLISELTQIEDGNKILELGCGTGRLTELLAQGTSSLVSTDRSEAMIARCKKKINNVNLIRSSVEDLPFKKEIFDTCISLRLIHHFRYDAINRILKQAKMCLKDNGIIVFNTTNIFGLSILSAWTNLFQRKFAFHHYSNQKRIKQLLRNNAFKFIENRRIFFIPSFVFRFLKSKYLADILWGLNEKLEKLFPCFCSMIIWKAENSQTNYENIVYK